MEFLKYKLVRLKDDGEEVRLRKLPEAEALQLVAAGEASFISRGTWRRYKKIKNKIERLNKYNWRTK